MMMLITWPEVALGFITMTGVCIIFWLQLR